MVRVMLALIVVGASAVFMSRYLSWGFVIPIGLFLFFLILLHLRQDRRPEYRDVDPKHRNRPGMF